jgi:hypothetical protein
LYADDAWARRNFKRRSAEIIKKLLKQGKDQVGLYEDEELQDLKRTQAKINWAFDCEGFGNKFSLISKG